MSTDASLSKKIAGLTFFAESGKQTFWVCVIAFLGSISMPSILHFIGWMGLHGLLVGLVFGVILTAVVAYFNFEVNRAMRTLAESESRHRDLVENLPSAVFRGVLTDQWRMTYISDAIEAMTGYKASDFSEHGRTLRDIMHPDDRGFLSEYDRNAKAQRFENDARFITKSGEIRWVHARGAIRIPEDGPAVASGILIDITEQKRVAELLTQQQSRMAAAARLSALGEMAGGIAHEINNPLAIISLRNHQLKQLAERGPVPPAEAAAIASGIEATVHRISKIVRSLQTVARESEHDPFERVPVRDIVNDAFELCFQRMRKHGIDVAVGEVPTSLELDCRRVQISQVLINLLNNSFDAVVNSPNPKVTITARDFIESGQPMVEIAITDSGTGITPDLAHRIFQPFFTTKGIGLGIGLGLSISKGLIESHDGHIRVDTTAPTTRFVIVLPKYHTKPRPPASKSRPAVNTAGAGAETLVHT